MDGIKNGLRKARYKLRHDFLAIENIVLAIAIILCLVWTYQSITAMSRNWELSERLTAEREKLELLTVETETLELENEYYKTNEYQELLARKFLDKKFEGEEMIIMPKNSEAAKNKHKTQVAENKEEKEYSNFEKWMMFLFPSY